MKILMVLTSQDKLGDMGRKTGFWLKEFAAPYFTFLDAGAEVTLASPKGGQPMTNIRKSLSLKVLAETGLRVQFPIPTVPLTSFSPPS